MDARLPDLTTRTWLFGIESRRDFFRRNRNLDLAGRGISEQDIDTAQHVAVINEAFARKFFNGENPVGKFFGSYEMGSIASLRDCGRHPKCPLSGLES